MQLITDETSLRESVQSQSIYLSHEDDRTFTTQVLAGDHNVYFILFQTAKAIQLGKNQEFDLYFDSEFFIE